MLLPALLFAVAGASVTRQSNAGDPPRNARPPTSAADWRYWLENMVVHHGFTDEEVRSATGKPLDEIARDRARFGLAPLGAPKRDASGPLLVLPYPGGRHPRIGFLDGAVDPQRETKVSVFAPWEGGGYAVVDVPEALWSNLGLTYLAHTHVDTIWTKQGIALPKLEWKRERNGSLKLERTLPNGIGYLARVRSGQFGVAMELELTNGTGETLTDLRVQNCVMLKGLRGFETQSGENKLLKKPFAAARSADGKRWVITVWTPCQRAWHNPPCPCIHSDPQFPDCPPGESRTVKGWLSFYEGGDIENELLRLDEIVRRELGVRKLE